MKNGKKLTAAVAVSAVATALVAPAAMAATTFTDITGNFAADAINALAAKGILSGNPDGTFAPNGNITREQFAVVLAKALNLDASGTSSFTDVDAWASGYVAAVSKAGFVSGYDATHFGGKDSLTREQMATILVRALTKQQGYDATGKGANLTFTDASSISSWAKDSVGAAVELGLIHGMTDGTFAPAANATRAQVALVTQAFMNVQINSVTVTASATLNSDNTATVTGKTTGSADSVKVTVDGGTAVAATLNTDGTYTYTTSVLASGSHTISVVASKGTTASQPASATVTVGTVGVASVKPLDARNIQVVFNTPMDTTQTTDYTDYSFSTGGGVAANPTAIAWSADGKTATLTFANSMINNDYYTLTISENLKDANANVLSTTAPYNTGFLWNDTTAPTVTAVKNALGGAVEIDFSKPLSVDKAFPTVVLNGTSVTVNASLLTEGATSITIPAATVQADASVGSTINVIVSGAQDEANTDGAGTHNIMSLYQGSLAYSLNAVTPVVQSLKATAENQLTLTFNEPIAQNVAVGNPVVTTDGLTNSAAALGLQIVDSTGVAVSGVTATTTDGQTFTITIPNAVYASGATTANLTVTVSGFEDSGYDLGNSTTQAVTLTQDATAPTLINTQYDTTNKVIDFTFNKDIVGSSSLTSDVTVINNTTGIAYDVSGDVSVTPGATGTKTLAINNASAELPPGTYTVNFAAGAVTDTTIAANANAAISQVVTVPSTTSTNGPSVTDASATVDSSSANVVTVDYSDAVKGGVQAGSATDVNNYKLNGAALPAGSTITLNGAGTAQTVATITLPSGTVSSTATEVLTVSNVQTLDGVAVATFNGTINLKDNTAPTLTAAKVNASGQLVLTFSEDVAGEGDAATIATGETMPVANDFVVTINGQTVDASAITVNDGAAESQVILTSTGASFASGTVVVKTNATSTVATDAAGNHLATGTTVTATH